MVAAAVIGGAFIALLAALPAPRLSVSRTPEVVPKHTPSGDVRNISIATDGPYVQTAVEVFDGTDFEIYYWTDFPGLTPIATSITADIIEQRWARIAVRGVTAVVAWIEDTDGGSIVRSTSKEARGYRYSWKPASTLLAADHQLGGLAVALMPDGKAVVAFVEQKRLWVTWPPGSTTLERVTTATAKEPAERNPSVSVADDGRVAIAFERGADIALSERSTSGWSAPRSVRGGRRPQLDPDGSGWRIGYTEGGGAGARIAVRSTVADLTRRYDLRLGTGAPVAITFIGGQPVVGYVTLDDKRQVGWLAGPGRSPMKLPVPIAKRSPSPSPSPRKP
jgi:hypothetical protein